MMRTKTTEIYFPFMILLVVIALAAACALTQFPSTRAAFECKYAAASRERRTFSSLLAHIVSSKHESAIATSPPQEPVRVDLDSC